MVNHDPEHGLPAHARRKLSALRQRAADANALATAAKATTDAARYAALSGKGEPGNLARCEAEQMRRQDRAAAEMAVLNTINNYVRTGRPVGADRRVKIPQDATLDRVRGEIKATTLAINSVTHAPATRAEQVAGIKAAVAAMADRGRPVVRQEGGRTVVERRAAVTFGESNPTPLHLLAWLDPEALIERLAAEIQDDPGAISTPRRERVLAELGGKLADLEALEEALVMQAEAEGRDVQRRRDCRPEIVLATVIDETATAQAA